MSAPNIMALSSITGKTDVLAITNSPAAITTNTAASGKCYKINSLVISNISGSVSGDVTVDVYRSSTAYRLAYLVTVSPKSALVIVGRDSPLYLEEGDAIRLTASANSVLEGVCSYEVLS